MTDFVQTIRPLAIGLHVELLTMTYALLSLACACPQIPIPGESFALASRPRGKLLTHTSRFYQGVLSG